MHASTKAPHKHTYIVLITGMQAEIRDNDIVWEILLLDRHVVVS